MNAWTRFFFGTPKRFVATLVVVLLALALLFPESAGLAVNHLLDALLRAIAPFVQPLLVLGVVFLGLGIMLRSVWHRPKGKK